MVVRTASLSLVLLMSATACRSDSESTCSITDDGSGGAIITCEDGTELVVSGGDDGNDGAAALVNVSDEPAGANCESGGQRIDIGLDNGDGGATAADGVLDAGEIDTTTYVCDGSDGTDGSDGSAGTITLIASTAEPEGANCATGGQRIDVGLDNGDGGGTADNGTLEEGEIDATSYVCNGDDGAAGADGAATLVAANDEAPGGSCANGGQRFDIGLDNGDGEGIAGNGILEPDEIDSTSFVCDGEDGAAGINTLLAVSNEPAGENCSDGGQRVDAGLDDGAGEGTANNGALEADEIDDTVFVCDGADGASSLIASTDEDEGDNCEFGGHRIDVGVDNGVGNGTAGNGTLESDEITDTLYVCDGGYTPPEITPTVTGFSGELGPDFTSEGLSQCGGIGAANYSSVMGKDFYALCNGYTEIVFACSTDSNTTAEYVSPAFPLSGSLTDSTCDNWTGGANSVYGSDFILSVDDSNPNCGNYNVAYDMYVHFGTQWGCNNVNNTHNTGGRMWAYVR